MAGSLIETLAGDFDPSQYTDGYREALQAVIDAKVAGREVVGAGGAGPPAVPCWTSWRRCGPSVDAAKGKKSAALWPPRNR